MKKRAGDRSPARRLAAPIAAMVVWPFISA